MLLSSVSFVGKESLTVLNVRRHECGTSETTSGRMFTSIVPPTPLPTRLRLPRTNKTFRHHKIFFF